MRNIILFGQKNSGKSSVGKILSEYLKRDFFDLDICIERLYVQENEKNLSYKEIFKIHGESFFRKIEKRALLSLKEITKSVISLGGGTLEDKSSFGLIQRMGRPVYLKITLDTFLQRTLKNNSPLNVHLKESYSKRSQIFDNLPAIVINSDSLTAEEVAKEVLNALE
jgi:shikimate kinase